MATYTYGSGASAAARPDLAPVVGRYMETLIADGAGGHGWGAFAACGVLEVTGPGRLTYDSSAFRFIPSTDNNSGIRPLNAHQPPLATPGAYTDYAVEPQERGLATSWDEADPQVRILANQRGAAAVESKWAMKSANHCLELVDNLVFGTAGLSASTSPFTATDVDVDADGSGTAWTVATATIATDLTTAFTNYEAATGMTDLDTLVVNAKVALGMALNSQLRTGITATATSGPMSPSMLLDALRIFGITRLVVVPTGKPLTDKAILMKGGGEDPLTTFCGSVLTWGRMPGYFHDQNGVSTQTWSAEAGRVHYAYVSHYSDIVIPADGGVRCADIY